jgi:hypothetical protein
VGGYLTGPTSDRPRTPTRTTFNNFKNQLRSHNGVNAHSTIPYIIIQNLHTTLQKPPPQKHNLTKFYTNCTIPT